MKLIRWKAVLPVTILLGVFILLVVLFLGSFIKWAMIRTGESIFGAKVEIESVQVSFRHSALNVFGVQVANKSAPMSNLFEIGKATFDFQALPLLEKKVVINDASVIGMRFGTPRKTSGALPFAKKEAGVVGKAVDRLASQVEKVYVDKFTDVKSWTSSKSVINTDKLASVQAAKAAKEKLTNLPQELQGRVNSLNAQKRADEIRAQIKALQQKSSGVEGALAKVQEAKKLQEDIQKLKSDIQSTKDAVTQDLSNAKSVVADVKKAKEDDWNTIRSTFQLPSLDKETLARSLLGPKVVGFYEKFMPLVEKGKTYMPAKATQAPPPPRGMSRIIEFPKEKVWPRFLLEKAQLAGEVGLNNPFQFDGLLMGVSTNPTLYGKPMTVTLKGGQGPRRLDANALMDHREGKDENAVHATFTGFPVSDLLLGSPDALALTLQKGVGQISGQVSVNNDVLAGQITVGASDLSVKPELKINSDTDLTKRLASNITSSLSAVKQLQASIALSGSLEDPKMSIQSNLGSVLSDAMKKAVGAEIEKQTQALRAQLDAATAKYMSELEGQLAKAQEQVLPQLGSQNKVVDDLLQQVKAAAAPSAGGAIDKPLNQLKGLFGK